MRRFSACLAPKTFGRLMVLICTYRRNRNGYLLEGHQYLVRIATHAR